MKRHIQQALVAHGLLTGVAKGHFSPAVLPLAVLILGGVANNNLKTPAESFFERKQRMGKNAPHGKVRIRNRSFDR